MRKLWPIAVPLLFASACGPGSLDDAVPPGQDQGRDGTTKTDRGRDASEEGWALLSLNLHCLFTSSTSYSSNEARFDAIAGAVRDEGVAVMAVQEACHSSDESAMPMLEAALEDTTGQTWSSAWFYTHQAWEGTANEASEGVGLLYRGSGGEVFDYSYYSQGDLGRALVAVTLPEALGGFTVASVHLDHRDSAVRAAQARETASVLLSAFASTELIVAGDLNARERSDTHQAFIDQGFDDLTANLSSGRIDHVFAHRGASLSPKGAWRIFDGHDYDEVSDHEGYMVWVGPGEGEPVELTRLVAWADAGWGNFLSARGGVAPLDWEQGLVAYPVEDYRWRLVLTEIRASSFEYKWLMNDADWQDGWNLEAEVGTDNESSPSF